MIFIGDESLEGEKPFDPEVFVGSVVGELKHKERDFPFDSWVKTVRNQISGIDSSLLLEMRATLHSRDVYRKCKDGEVSEFDYHGWSNLVNQVDTVLNDRGDLPPEE